MSLFDHPRSEPLAATLRPEGFADFFGQEHLTAEGSLLRRSIENDCFSSIIFTGPPGTGKTSLASIISKYTEADFIALSAIDSSVSEVRKAVKAADEARKFSGRKTVLFVDEIHRFNKAQQDSLLKDIENGTVRFIGATTHNPGFYLTPALCSRSLIFTLKPLEAAAINALLNAKMPRILQSLETELEFEEQGLKFLSENCEGDARRALTVIELAVKTAQAEVITLDDLRECLQVKSYKYDADAHYNAASAFIKSMRGSDPDAAVYWLAYMLEAGEDIRFIARRIMIFASEDVGNADPRALQLAVSASQAVDIVGMPEARIILSQAVTYCATAPKSNAAYKAVNLALDDVRNQRSQVIPMHLRDPRSSGYNPEEGDYVYPHNSKEAYVKQEYIGVETQYYQPVERGYETKIKERMDYWRDLRGEDESKADS